MFVSLKKISTLSGKSTIFSTRVLIITEGFSLRASSMCFLINDFSLNVNFFYYHLLSIYYRKMIRHRPSLYTMVQTRQLTSVFALPQGQRSTVRCKLKHRNDSPYMSKRHSIRRSAYLENLHKNKKPSIATRLNKPISIRPQILKTLTYTRTVLR